MGQRKSKERERKRREKRRVKRSSFSSSDFSLVRSSLQRLAGGKSYKDDEHSVLRPAITGVKRRLDVEEPPVETLTLPAPSLQAQENMEAVVEQVLGKFIPRLLQQLGISGAPRTIPP
jgi:hypothetical protein